MNSAGLLVFLILAGPGYSLTYLVPYQRALDTVPTVDDTHARFNLAMTDSRLKARLGQQVALIRWQQNDEVVALNISPFLEIHNYESGQSAPWQMWRGQLGLNACYNRPLKKISAALRAQFEGGFYHESDHLTDQSGYLETFIRNGQAEAFDNKSIRSFEYFRVKATLFMKTAFAWPALAIGARVFTHPLNRYADRLQKESLFVEIKVGRPLFSAGILWFTAFYEGINTNLSPIADLYVISLPGFLNYRLVEVSWQVRSESSASFEVYLGYEDSNGRGIDFANQYRGLRLGLRLEL